MNHGLLTNRAGCPVAISVYAGNTGDAKTLPDQGKQLPQDFGLERLVRVVDRGMISHKAIEGLRTLEELAWITALKSSQIRVENRAAGGPAAVSLSPVASISLQIHDIEAGADGYSQPVA